MGRKSLYYLIARDRETNDFSIVKINQKRGVTLEDIDLYTTQFSDANQMRDMLQADSVITYDDVDFFVASPSKVNGNIELKKYEVLYKNNDSIQKIAENSKINKISRSDEQIDRILDYFATQVKSRPALYDLLITGKTNIYEKYAKYFAYTNYNVLKSIKYLDGGWARISYPLIRNVLEALSSVERDYSRTSDEMHRDLLDSKLKQVTARDYDENQLTMFDMYPLEEEQYASSVHKAMKTFETLPRDVFTNTPEGIHINTSMFYDCDTWDVERLDSFLPTQLMSRIQMLLIHRDYLNNSKYPFCNSYLSSVERDQEGIIKFLRNNQQKMNQIINWCDIFESNRDKVLGDEYGYQKRKEQ